MTINNISVKLTDKQIVDAVNDWLNGCDKRKLETLEHYYEADNTAMANRFNKRSAKRILPNNLIQTPYYSSIVDSMAGYLFSNVSYTAETETDEDYVEQLNDILYADNVEVKDMRAGIQSLCYNRGLELVYTVGDGVTTKIKFATLDPEEVVLIYDDQIEPQLYCAIRISECDKQGEYDLDVIYSDEWQYKHMTGKALITTKKSKQLLFSECPVVEYNTSILTDDAPFETIIPYIDGLDALVSGNSNELEKLAEAILVIGKKLKPEDMQDMESWKVLQDMSSEDRAEYIQRDSSPAFREYISKLLINEIYRHSHVVDFYSAEQGNNSSASGRALRIRMHDQEMYAERLEKSYRQGAVKRIKLITEIMALLKMPVGYCNIEFNRKLPSEIEDIASAMNNLSFLPLQTKCELLGLDYQIVKQQLEDEQKKLSSENEVNNIV